MAKTGCRLIYGWAALLLSNLFAAAQLDLKAERPPRAANLAESVSVHANGALLKLLIEFRKEAQGFIGESSTRAALDAHLEGMLQKAAIPLLYLALADAQGDIVSSSPLYTVPEEWGIGRFPELAEKGRTMKSGYMHYVPALLDRPATLAFIFPVQTRVPAGEGADPEKPHVLLALIDSQRAFETLLKDRLLLPWETVKIWGPDGDLLYSRGTSAIHPAPGHRAKAFFLNTPEDLPGDRILQEPSGVYQGYHFSLMPFRGLEHRIYWHQSVFIGGDRWVVLDIIEKPLNREDLPVGEMTGLWVAQSDPAARLVSVQSGSSWEMLISLDGQVTRAEGRILNEHLVAYHSEGVNVTSCMLNIRGRFDAAAKSIELNWIQDSGKALGGRTMRFLPDAEADMLPAVDANRIRLRVFQ